MKNIFLILLSLIFSGQLFADTAEEIFKKRIKCQQGILLTVKNRNGSIEVQSWDADEVEIIAYKKVRTNSSRSARELLTKIEVEIDETEDEIYVETLFPRYLSRNDGFFDWLFDGNDGRGSFSVKYEIRTPRKMDLNINTTNGRVEVSEISGRMRLESTNGKIVAEKISGVVRSSTTNGSILAAFDQINGSDEMYFKTTNGSVKLYLPEDYGATVSLKTTNGRIKSDFPLTVRGGSEMRKNRYYGKVHDGGGELTCKTTNGSIYLLYND